MANLKPRLQSGTAAGVDAGQAARNRVYARLSDAEMYALTEAATTAAFSDQLLTAEQAEALDKFWTAVDAEMEI